MELTQIITELPVVGALLVLVLMFLKHLKSQREDFKETINNHLHDHKESIDKNTEVLGGLKDIVKDFHYFLKRSNGHKK